MLGVARHLGGAMVRRQVQIHVLLHLLLDILGIVLGQVRRLGSDKMIHAISVVSLGDVRLHAEIEGHRVAVWLECVLHYEGI